MSELTLTLLRLGLLALLWAFVFSVVAVLRTDLFGTRVSRRHGGRRARTGTPTPGVADPGNPRHPTLRGRAARGIPRALVVIEGRLAGTTIPLGSQGVLIGRDPECALVLDDDFASGKHARIFPGEQGWLVEDLRSTNGTLLGTIRLTTPLPIGIGSQLRIGRTVLELQG